MGLCGFEHTQVRSGRDQCGLLKSGPKQRQAIAAALPPALQLHTLHARALHTPCTPLHNILSDFPMLNRPRASKCTVGDLPGQSPRASLGSPLGPGCHHI